MNQIEEEFHRIHAQGKKQKRNYGYPLNNFQNYKLPNPSLQWIRFCSASLQPTAPLNSSLARQAKPGESFRVKVPVGEGLTTHPYRVLRDWEG